MAEVTAALVKDLREKSGAGMMDCKKALNETGGDIEAAIDWLRKKGLAAAAKKAGRVAAEGLVGVATSGTRGAVVEINAETDFVARNDQFQGFVTKAAELALGLGGNDIDALTAAPFGEGKTLGETLTALIAAIGENMSARRTGSLSVTNGVVAGYMHNQLVPGLGKIGVLVALESTGDQAKLTQTAKQIAMHVAAANPIALNVSSVDTSVVDREKDVLRAQAAASGKAPEIIEKMLDGRLRKFYEEVVLLEQVYVVDGETKVKDVVAKLAKELGTGVELTGFIRYALGEGIEKQVSDFAAEVAAQAGLKKD